MGGAKIKSYTSLEQSHMLAEILPIESADAFYDTAEPEKRQVPIIGNPDDYCDMEDWTIPCWSLAALLVVLDFPCLTQENDNEIRYKNEFSFLKVHELQHALRLCEINKEIKV